VIVPHLLHLDMDMVIETLIGVSSIVAQGDELAHHLSAVSICFACLIQHGGQRVAHHEGLRFWFPSPVRRRVAQAGQG
jgi:hypothetical protein